MKKKRARMKESNAGCNVDEFAEETGTRLIALATHETTRSPASGAHVCSLTFVYHRGYCSEKNASSVERISAGFSLLPKKLQYMGSFCVVSDQTTICFCPDSCNTHAASMVSAMENSNEREYGVVYHRYYHHFVPASETRTSEILSCLTNEFKSDTAQNNARLYVNTVAKRPKRIGKRATDDAGGKQDGGGEDETSNGDAGGDEDEWLLLAVVGAGGAGPLIMLLVAYCIFTSMEKKRRQQEGDVGADEPGEGGEGAPGEGESQDGGGTPGASDKAPEAPGKAPEAPGKTPAAADEAPEPPYDAAGEPESDGPAEEAPPAPEPAPAKDEKPAKKPAKSAPKKKLPLKKLKISKPKAAKHKGTPKKSGRPARKAAKPTPKRKAAPGKGGRGKRR
ncbi:hypothetical protein Y032_0411g961 [Ancylostoma ceylanicum]|uniref:Uncharacterized protein n=2 Tax=Ancylostoma ceylanicum TaxID=53326 RepID=A0A016X442_9BILA|nr:hypothetical protein Y032_0411g961 [Ancylostoma ceylanicum]